MQSEYRDTANRRMSPLPCSMSLPSHPNVLAFARPPLTRIHTGHHEGPHGRAATEA